MSKLIEFDYYISPQPERREFNLHDAKALFVISITGRGMPPTEYITERGPLQHGESLIDYRLRPRLITMITRRRFPCRQDYWDGRNDLLDALRPNRQQIGCVRAGTLRKVLPDGSMRDVDVMIESGPAFQPRNPERWDEIGFSEVLRFVAYDPTFYDPIQLAEQWTLTPTVGNLIFYEAPGYLDRLVFPIWFAGQIISNYLNITYIGTWPAFPTIVVTGPADNLIVRNVTTDERLFLDYFIQAGEVVTITLDYGNKTITNQLGENLLPYLSSDSDLATFHLEPAPGAAGGVNQMYVFANSVAVATAVELQWYTRYIGI